MAGQAAAHRGGGLASPLALGRSLALTRPPGLYFDALPICRASADGEPVPPAERKKVTFAWNAGAPCLLAVTVAQDKGFFARHGLDVDLFNYAGSTDQLLETMATGKGDAAVGMALRWLKPLEQGFDVKIVASLHGGCMRLLAPINAGVDKIEDLKGKIIGVSDMNSPAKNFFAIVIRKAGLELTKNVEFKQFPGPLLRVAVDKGEAHALADGDPNPFLWLKDGKLKEISSNLAGEFVNRACCIVGVRGSLIWLPQPFFPLPHAILEVFTDDAPKLAESVVASLKLETSGLAFGAGFGFLVGLALGRSRAFGYWAHPILRLIGPLPAIAWLPIAFFAFPSGWSASIFLIALTTGFPVAVLTWSGVAGVDPACYDIPRALGASRAFLVFKVAIPVALPQVFVGLFMGLGASFAVLVTAEMMGVARRTA